MARQTLDTDDLDAQTKVLEDLAKVGSRSGDIKLRAQVVTVLLEMAIHV